MGRRRGDADVEYSQEVTAIGLAAVSDGRPIVEVATASGDVFHARSIVVAPGRSPNIPAVFSDIGRPWALHSSAYLDGIADLPAGYTGTLAVVGASQSSIEVVLDLARRLPRATVVNVMSGFGYRLKDTSPFSEEVYFPEFVDYGRTRVTMRTNRAIDGARVAGDKVTLTMTERITGQREQCVADRVILATGYRDLGVHERYELLPPLLSDLADIVRMDQDLGLSVGIDYRVDTTGEGRDVPPIYVNGLCETTHGMGDAGSCLGCSCGLGLKGGAEEESTVDDVLRPGGERRV